MEKTYRKRGHQQHEENGQVSALSTGSVAGHRMVGAAEPPAKPVR